MFLHSDHFSHNTLTLLLHQSFWYTNHNSCKHSSLSCSLWWEECYGFAVCSQFPLLTLYSLSSLSLDCLLKGTVYPKLKWLSFILPIMPFQIHILFFCWTQNVNFEESAMHAVNFHVTQLWLHLPGGKKTLKVWLLLFYFFFSIFLVVCLYKCITGCIEYTKILIHWMSILYSVPNQYYFGVILLFFIFWISIYIFCFKSNFKFFVILLCFFVMLSRLCVCVYVLFIYFLSDLVFVSLVHQIKVNQNHVTFIVLILVSVLILGNYKPCTNSYTCQLHLGVYRWCNTWSYPHFDNYLWKVWALLIV